MHCMEEEPQLTTVSAELRWQHIRQCMRANMLRSRNMFDDGRFLRSVVAEARQAGLKPVLPPRPGSALPAHANNAAAGSAASAAPLQLLRRNTSLALAREPKVAPLLEGIDGGGGVRLYPSNLEEALQELSSCFVPARPANDERRPHADA